MLAVEEVEEVLDEPGVLLGVDVAHAGRRTLLDVRVQAGPAEAMVPVELRVGARADRERAQEQVERLPDRVRVRVGPEVADALAVLAPHHHRPRPLLVEGHRQVRVRLVVLQPDVETGLVPLDEVELEEERLDLVLGDDPLDPVGGLHHLVGALGQRRGWREVVREAAAQALRLPDVDDPALDVEELVRAGGVGDGSGLRAIDHGSIVAGAPATRGPFGAPFRPRRGPPGGARPVAAPSLRPPATRSTRRCGRARRPRFATGPAARGRTRRGRAGSGARRPAPSARSGPRPTRPRSPRRA